MILTLIIVLIIISVIDLREKTIYDGVTLFGIIVALNWQLFMGDIHSAVLGLTAGVGIIWIMNLSGIAKFGGGDAKLLALIGTCTDWKIVTATFVVSYLLCSPLKYGFKKHNIAYAPFMTVAFILIMGIMICLNET